jgi:hypothetical protein
VSITIAVPDSEELVAHLPDDHDLRARLADDDNAVGKREPDNVKLRTALQSGRSIPGAEVRRGQHVRLS